MKIIHLIMLYGIGGSEAHFFDLINNYPDKQVEHVIVNGVSEKNIKRRSSEWSYIQNKLAQTQARFIEWDSNLLPSELVEIIKNENADLIHVFNPKDFLVPAYLSYLLLGVPQVFVWHNPSNFEISYKKWPFENYIYKQLSSENVALCSLARHSSREFEKAYKLAFVPSLGNGIDISRFAFSQDNRKKIRSQYQIPNDALVIGSVSRVDLAWKRQNWIIDALELLHLRGFKNVYACIVGGGRDLKKLKEMAENKGLKDYIVFAGPQDDPSHYYSAFDIFAHPSKTENVGRVIIEALACSLPTLISTYYQPDGTDVEGYGIVRNGINGIIVWDSKDDFIKKLEELVQDKELRLRLSSSSASSVEHYDVKYLGERYCKLFTEEAKKRRAPQLKKYAYLLKTLNKPIYFR